MKSLEINALDIKYPFRLSVQMMLMGQRCLKAHTVQAVIQSLVYHYQSQWNDGHYLEAHLARSLWRSIPQQQPLSDVDLPEYHRPHLVKREPPIVFRELTITC